MTNPLLLALIPLPGKLPLSVQSRLLRVQQSGQLQGVGSDREHQVDCGSSEALPRQPSQAWIAPI